MGSPQVIPQLDEVIPQLDAEIPQLDAAPKEESTLKSRLMNILGEVSGNVFSGNPATKGLGIIQGVGATLSPVENLARKGVNKIADIQNSRMDVPMLPNRKDGPVFSWGEDRPTTGAAPIDLLTDIGTGSLLGAGGGALMKFINPPIAKAMEVVKKITTPMVKNASELSFKINPENIVSVYADLELALKQAKAAKNGLAVARIENAMELLKPHLNLGEDVRQGTTAVLSRGRMLPPSSDVRNISIGEADQGRWVLPQGPKQITSGAIPLNAPSANQVALGDAATRSKIESLPVEWDALMPANLRKSDPYGGLQYGRAATTLNQNKEEVLSQLEAAKNSQLADVTNDGLTTTKFRGVPDKGEPFPFKWEEGKTGQGLDMGTGRMKVTHDNVEQVRESLKAALQEKNLPAPLKAELERKLALLDDMEVANPMPLVRQTPLLTGEVPKKPPVPTELNFPDDTVHYNAVKAALTAQPAAQLALKEFPSDATVGIQSWRPTLDLLDKYIPEVTQKASTAFHEGNKFMEHALTVRKEIQNMAFEGLSKGERKLVDQMATDMLSGKTSMDVPLNNVLGMRAKVYAQDMRSRFFDPIISMVKNSPEVKSLWGDVIKESDYYPLLQAKDTHGIFQPWMATGEGGTPTFVRDVNPKGYKPSIFKRRTLGDTPPNPDITHVTNIYLREVTRGVFDIPMYDGAKNLVAQIPKGSSLRNLADRYLDYYVGAPSTMAYNKPLMDAANWINARLYHSMLGLNIPSAKRNVTQLINTAAEAGIGNTAGEILSGNWLRKSSRAARKASGSSLEVPGLEQGTRDMVQNTVGDKFMGPFNFSEGTVNRGVTYNVGAKGKSTFNGYVPQEGWNGVHYSKDAYKLSPAEKAGTDLVDKTQFSFGRLNPVEMSNNPFVRVASAFVSYPTRQASFMMKLAENAVKTGNVGPLAKYMLMSSGLAAAGSEVHAGFARVLTDAIISPAIPGKSPGIQILYDLSDAIKGSPGAKPLSTIARDIALYRVPAGLQLKKIVVDTQKGYSPQDIAKHVILGIPPGGYK
jgi:hypothetical protein